MAISKIPGKTQIRTVQNAVSISANGRANFNLKTLIDADLPSGYRYGGLAGYDTGNVYVFAIAVRYRDTDYSMHLKNTSSSALTLTASVDYIAIAE